jgi:hypothetical protein
MSVHTWIVGTLVGSVVDVTVGPDDGDTGDRVSAVNEAVVGEDDGTVYAVSVGVAVDGAGDAGAGDGPVISPSLASRTAATSLVVLSSSCVSCSTWTPRTKAKVEPMTKRQASPKNRNFRFRRVVS